MTAAEYNWSEKASFHTSRLAGREFLLEVDAWVPLAALSYILEFEESGPWTGYRVGAA